MTATTIATMIAEVKRMMVEDQRAFNKHPNSANWIVAQRGMLAYQQAMQVAKMPLAKQDRLLQQLDDLPMGMWNECVVRAVTGQSIGQILH